MDARKQKALAALLSNHSRKEAAKAAGVSDRTLRNYFHDPEFLEQYKEAYSDMLQDAVAEGRRLLHLSMRTFEDVMKNGDMDAARVTAARSAIEYTMKLTEQVDIMAELEELKRVVFSDEG